MSTEKEPSKGAKKHSESEALLRIRVLKSGTIIDGAKCAKTLITSTTKAKAEALQEQGLKIIGV